MKKIIFSLLIIVLSIAACTKSTDKKAPAIPPRNDETPLASSLYNNESSYKFYSYNPQQKETGYAFQALKKGVIWAMGIRMPAVGQDFIVTFWDSASHNIIKQKTIRNSSNTSFTYVDLSSEGYKEDFEIEKNKTCYITVNTSATVAGTPNRQFYALTKANSEEFLPLTKGNIKMLSGLYSSTAAPSPTYPDKTNFDVFGLHMLFGLADIGFYATEY